MNRVIRILAGCLSILALSVPVAGATAASPPPESSKPTVVLVHGAWADSGSWDGVIQRLQQKGYKVLAAPDPLRGLAYDSETVAGFIHTVEGPIILVGHSYGGEVITDAAAGDKEVKALVYVDAFVPDKGESLTDLIGGESCFHVPDPTFLLNFAPFPGAPKGVFDSYLKPSTFASCFANGLPATQTAILEATQRPLATNALGEKSGQPAWKTIPSWSVVGTADHVIPEVDQLAMDNRAHSHVTKVDAPHLSMVAAPEVVAGVIVKAAKATH